MPADLRIDGVIITATCQKCLAVLKPEEVETHICPSNPIPPTGTPEPATPFEPWYHAPDCPAASMTVQAQCQCAFDNPAASPPEQPEGNALDDLCDLGCGIVHSLTCDVLISGGRCGRAYHHSGEHRLRTAPEQQGTPTAQPEKPNMDSNEKKETREEHLLGWAWSIIANVDAGKNEGRGVWTSQTPEWREAAQKWADDVHSQLVTGLNR